VLASGVGAFCRESRKMHEFWNEGLVVGSMWSVNWGKLERKAWWWDLCGVSTGRSLKGRCGGGSR
jgi:hypothetical protein